MTTRIYRWRTEFDDAAETPVLVVATVTGRDGWWSPQAVSPPEQREVEIDVRRTFCPSWPDRDGCTGCEYEDVTARASEEWLDAQRETALERDDEAADKEAEERT